jgi:hypothetical protein
MIVSSRKKQQSLPACRCLATTPNTPYQSLDSFTTRSHVVLAAAISAAVI